MTAYVLTAWWLGDDGRTKRENIGVFVRCEKAFAEAEKRAGKKFEWAHEPDVQAWISMPPTPDYTVEEFEIQ